jgi:hypothetical protein
MLLRRLRYFSEPLRLEAVGHSRAAEAPVRCHRRAMQLPPGVRGSAILLRPRSPICRRIVAGPQAFAACCLIEGKQPLHIPYRVGGRSHSHLILLLCIFGPMMYVRRSSLPSAPISARQRHALRAPVAKMRITAHPICIRLIGIRASVILLNSAKIITYFIARHKIKAPSLQESILTGAPLKSRSTTQLNLTCF